MGQRPLSYGKCRFLVLGMGVQFWMLLLMIASVSSFILIMVLIYTQSDTEGLQETMNTMSDAGVITGFILFIPLMAMMIFYFGFVIQLRHRFDNDELGRHSCCLSCLTVTCCSLCSAGEMGVHFEKQKTQVIRQHSEKIKLMP